MNDQDRCEKICRRICEEAGLFFAEIEQEDANVLTWGFEVLYGPPAFRCPVLLLGLQPGGGERSRMDDLWPKECEYASAQWPLARRLQGVFGTSFLAQCTGTNAIFARAPKFDV
jgi:hypothetical protein